MCVAKRKIHLYLNHSSSESIQAILFILFILFQPFHLLADEYDDSDYSQPQYLVVDRTSFDNQMAGWEWLVLEESESKTTSYPYALSFYTYSSHPDYIVRYDNNAPAWSFCAVYDKDGSLIRIPYLIKNRLFYSLCQAYAYALDERNKIQRKNEENRIKANRDFKNYCVSVYDAKLNKITLPEGYGFNRSLGGLVSSIEKKKKGKYEKELSSDDLHEILDNGDILSKANADTSLMSLNLKIIDVNEKNGTKLILILPTINQSAPNPEIQIKPSAVAFKGYQSEPSVVYEYCSKFLLKSLLIEAYQNNKYGIHNESNSVRRIIEDKLSVKVKDTDLLKEVCGILRYRYREGMTMRQLVANMVTSDRITEFDAKEKIRDAQKQAYFERYEMTYSDGKTPSGLIASRFFSQIKQDHADELEPIAFNRVDETSFDIVFLNDRVVRVEFKQVEPFSCDYSFKLISK